MELQTGNGNANTALPFDPSIVENVAAHIATILQSGRSTDAPGGKAAPAASTKRTAPTWMSFARGLDQLVASNKEFNAAVEATMARCARQALAAGDLAVPSTEDFRALLHDKQPATRGGTSVHAYWWGFNVLVSHEDLQTFLATSAAVNTIVETIGGNIPVAGTWIQLVGIFIAASLALLKALDAGRGVYISMSWFAAGLFVPTTA